MNDIDLRDFFAAQAISGILSTQKIPRDLDQQQQNRRETLKEVARDAYAIADALLAERAKAQPNKSSG